MSIDLRVQAWDVNSNTLLTDCVGAMDIQFSVRLNDAGDCQFAVDVTDPIAKATYAVLDGLHGQIFKAVFTVNNNQTIVFTALMWQAEKKSGQNKVTYKGKALTSYFQDVRIPNSYTGSWIPNRLIAQVVADVQAIEPAANRGIQTRLVGLNTPPAITAAYNKYQNTLAGQVLADMTAGAAPGIGGTDYYMQDAFVNGVPQHVLCIASPRAGRDYTQSGFSINLQQAIDWDWPVDNFQSANRVVVVGGGTGGTQPSAVADNLLRGGPGQQPLMEMVLQYSQITVQSQLQTIANGAIRRFGQPVATPVVTVRADYEPCPLGSYIIGDDVLLQSDPVAHFPNGYATWWRIVQYQVINNNEGVPQVKLTLNPPPIF